MGILADRFHLRLLRRHDPQAESRAIERWANQLPYPECKTTIQATDLFAITNAFATAPISVQFTTFHPNAPVSVDFTCDFHCTVAGFGLAQGHIVIDGVVFTIPTCIFGTGATGDIGRATVSTVLNTVIVKPGAHNVQLEVRKTVNAGTITLRSNNTTIRVTTYA